MAVRARAPAPRFPPSSPCTWSLCAADAGRRSLIRVWPSCSPSFLVGSRWLRHLPVAALLACLGVLALASARPELTTDVPTQKTSIILALDESGSMCSTDVLPNRLAVAQKAAMQFVNSQSGGTQIGLVLFNGFAELAVAPTRDRSALDHALGNLSTGPGTAIGSAILQSLDAIAEIDPQVQPVANAVLGASATPSAFGSPAGGSNSAGGSAPTSSPSPVPRDMFPTSSCC